MPKLKFKLPEIETQNLSLICGPVNANIEQIESSLSIKKFLPFSYSVKNIQFDFEISIKKY